MQHTQPRLIATDDLPLFSQTAPAASVEPFTPHEQHRQHSMLPTWTEWKRAHGSSIDEMMNALIEAGIDPDCSTWSRDTADLAADVLAGLP